MQLSIINPLDAFQVRQLQPPRPPVLLLVPCSPCCFRVAPLPPLPLPPDSISDGLRIPSYYMKFYSGQLSASQPRADDSFDASLLGSNSCDTNSALQPLGPYYSPDSWMDGWIPIQPHVTDDDDPNPLY